MRVRKGDWIKARIGGITQKKKVLEKRPDGVLIVGNHDNDPDTKAVQPNDVIEKM